MTTEIRFLLYHKQSISARTLFLKFAGGSVLAPAPLPFLSSPVDPEQHPESDFDGQLHPATLAKELADGLGLPASLFAIDPDFRERIETPRGEAQAYLAGFTGMDPPRELAAGIGASFQPITELRGGHPVEMDLLRKAYEHLLGG